MTSRSRYFLDEPEEITKKKTKGLDVPDVRVRIGKSDES
jgi:hypothetical protein